MWLLMPETAPWRAVDIRTALNSIQPGGIHPSPNQKTFGNGSITGHEVKFDITFTTPFNLQADLFFVPRVTLANAAQFYWLSASRPDLLKAPSLG